MRSEPASSPTPAAASPRKGRGTVWPIEHRFASTHKEALDDGWGTLDQAAQEEQVAPGTRLIEESVRSILTGNDSPDIGFDLSINPYRGCEHGCTTATRGRRTATSTCRPGSISRPGSSPR